MKAFAGAHSYLFLVNTRLDVNHDALIVVVGNVVHRLLNGPEITRSISGHDNLFALTTKKHKKHKRIVETS